MAYMTSDGMDSAGPSARMAEGQDQGIANLERLFQQSGQAVTYRPGMDYSNLAFARPYLNEGSANPFGSPIGPQEGWLAVPKDVYNKISPQTSGGDFFSGLGQAAKDLAPGLAVGLGAPAGVGALTGAGIIPTGTGLVTGAGIPAAGAAMPAAQALSPEALSSMGLTQTAPGVWETVGAGGIGATLGGSGFVPGQSGNLTVTGASAGGTGAPVGAPQPPAGGAPAGPTGAPPPVPPPTTNGGGTGIVDTLIKQMKDNALGLGLIGASTLMAGGKSTPLPNEQQISALGTEAADTARQLISQYKSGNLSPGQQASLDQLTNNTKNQLKQYFASIGQGDSTAAIQSLAQVDQTAAAMKQQMLDSSLQQGLQAIGVAQGPLNTIAQYQLGQDQQLRQAFGNFAGSVGSLLGRGAGTQQQTTTSATATPTITSAQNATPAP